MYVTSTFRWYRTAYAFWAAAFVVGILVARPARPQGTSAHELEIQLKTRYRLTTIGSSGDASTISPGTVLVVQKPGILALSRRDPMTEQVAYKNGELHTTNSGLTMPQGKHTRPLLVGEKVYVTSISVRPKEDTVMLNITPCNSPFYNAQIILQYPKAYVQTADTSGLAEVIDNVLLPEVTFSLVQQPVRVWPVIWNLRGSYGLTPTALIVEIEGGTAKRNDQLPTPEGAIHLNALQLGVCSRTSGKNWTMYPPRDFGVVVPLNEFSLETESIYQFARAEVRIPLPEKPLSGELALRPTLGKHHRFKRRTLPRSQ